MTRSDSSQRRNVEIGKSDAIRAWEELNLCTILVGKVVSQEDIFTASGSNLEIGSGRKARDVVGRQHRRLNRGICFNKPTLTASVLYQEICSGHVRISEIRPTFRMTAVT